jgi:hypothetical protein
MNGVSSEQMEVVTVRLTFLHLRHLRLITADQAIIETLTAVNCARIVAAIVRSHRQRQMHDGSQSEFDGAASEPCPHHLQCTHAERRQREP